MSQFPEARLRAMVAAVDDALAGVQDARENSHTLESGERTHIEVYLDTAHRNLADALAILDRQRKLITC